MDELLDRPTRWLLPPCLSVITWPRSDGGMDVWLEALALDADGPDLEAAAAALVGEVRALAEGWLTDDRLRRAPNWRKRGPLVASLSGLSDAQIAACFIFVPGGDQPARAHLDDDDVSPASDC